MGMRYLCGSSSFRLAFKGRRQRLKKISQKMLTRRFAPSWLGGGGSRSRGVAIGGKSPREAVATSAQ